MHIQSCSRADSKVPCQGPSEAKMDTIPVCKGRQVQGEGLCVSATTLLGPAALGGVETAAVCKLRSTVAEASCRTLIGDSAGRSDIRGFCTSPTASGAPKWCALAIAGLINVTDHQLGCHNVNCRPLLSPCNHCLIYNPVKRINIMARCLNSPDSTGMADLPLAIPEEDLP